MPTFSPVRFAFRALSVAVLATTLGACEELTSVDASFANTTSTVTLFSLNGGSPPGSPNAIKFFDALTTPTLRADQGFAFDVVFDLKDDGKVEVIPSKALATTFSNPYSVALQQVSGTFESVLEAPKEGYRADTSMVVSVGQVVVVESRDVSGICAFSIKGQSYFTKLVVTAIDPAKRTMDVMFTVNRNCGFRSFEPGIPRN